MQLKLYSLVFFSLELALLATGGMAYYDDDYELASRELGLDGFAHHYLREFSESDLSHIATRELVMELEDRLVRRGGKPKKPKRLDWSTLGPEKLQAELKRVEGLLDTAKGKKQKERLRKQIAILNAHISKLGGSTGGGAGGGVAGAKTNPDPTTGATDANIPDASDGTSSDA